MPEDRRLTTIMFTDIVGYTALMGSDEDRALKTLLKNREINQQLAKNKMKMTATPSGMIGCTMLICYRHELVYVQMCLTKKLLGVHSYLL